MLSRFKIEKIEEFYLLGYNLMDSVVSGPALWKRMPPSSSGSKNKPIKKPV
jgi:hypothetical protein